MNQPTALRALEDHWQTKLPDAFGRLYRAFEYPYISPCEFFSLEELLEDGERWRGMLPQFLPFGQDGEENYFGFYVPHTASDGANNDYAVLAWDHEYDHYYPVASGFEAFLGWCVIYGRYVAQDTFEEDTPEYAEEEEQRHEFANLLKISSRFVTGPLPRNNRELNEQIVHADAQNARALCRLGCHFFGQAELERARDCFVRASEAAPWFADPYYLLAETYRVVKEEESACRLWWKVFELPIALSTRTTAYDLGTDHVEAEIYEIAADRCLACRHVLEDARQKTSLWELLQQGDPFSSTPRLQLAEALRKAGDEAGVERELLNALTLATEEVDIQAAYERLIAWYEQAGRHRDALFCRRDAAHT